MGSRNPSLPYLSTIFDKIHLLCCNTKTIKSPLFLGSIITGNFHLLPYWECTWCICRKLKSYTEPPLSSLIWSRKFILYQQNILQQASTSSSPRISELWFGKYQVTSLLTQISLSLRLTLLWCPVLTESYNVFPHFVSQFLKSRLTLLSSQGREYFLIWFLLKR